MTNEALWLTVTILSYPGELIWKLSHGNWSTKQEKKSVAMTHLDTLHLLMKANMQAGGCAGWRIYQLLSHHRVLHVLSLYANRIHL